MRQHFLQTLLPARQLCWTPRPMIPSGMPVPDIESLEGASESTLTTRPLLRLDLRRDGWSRLLMRGRGMKAFPAPSCSGLGKVFQPVACSLFAAQLNILHICWPISASFSQGRPDNALRCAHLRDAEYVRWGALLLLQYDGIRVVQPRAWLARRGGLLVETDAQDELARSCNVPLFPPLLQQVHWYLHRSTWPSPASGLEILGHSFCKIAEQPPDPVQMALRLLPGPVRSAHVVIQSLSLAVAVNCSILLDAAWYPHQHCITGPELIEGFSQVPACWFRVCFSTSLSRCACSKIKASIAIIPARATRCSRSLSGRPSDQPAQSLQPRAPWADALSAYRTTLFIFLRTPPGPLAAASERQFDATIILAQVVRARTAKVLVGAKRKCWEFPVSSRRAFSVLEMPQLLKTYKQPQTHSGLASNQLCEQDHGLLRYRSSLRGPRAKLPRKMSEVNIPAPALVPFQA